VAVPVTAAKASTGITQISRRVALLLVLHLYQNKNL